MKEMIFVLCFIMMNGSIFSQNIYSGSNENEQSDEIKNVIHSDIGTMVFWGFWSVNYEATLKHNPGKSILRFRTGFLYRFDDHFYGVPLSLTALFGKVDKYFELTAGIVPVIDEEWHEGEGYYSNRFSVYPLIDIGYRHEPGKGKWFYRFKLGSSGIGIGFGYAF